MKKIKIYNSQLASVNRPVRMAFRVMLTVSARVLRISMAKRVASARRDFTIFPLAKIAIVIRPV